ncbi:cell division protein ZauP [Caulobacter sp. SL161]|uniref:cell division protein ZauP n=1 Tax=Caulobacter sp. SL161 TaxID=2995156 RepID=UPI0022756B30|nr:cell division protein ZauP [Caulobacter sp. SL161]MCY1645553.1 cell division protein ZauP [Caulobacter sp. SL161]
MIPADSTALDLAVRRLERAVSQLEQRIAAKAAETQRALAAAATSAVASSLAVTEPSLFDDDERARLVADLEAAREREKALEEAGEQASVALGRAIAEIRAALGDESVANDLHAPGDDDDLFEDSEEA